MMGSIYLAADAIAVGGSAAQREAWLPRLASGEIIGTAAVEPGEPTLRLVDGRLEGRVAPLLWGSQAAVAVVNARDGNRNNLFLVDLAQDTVTRDRLNTIDDSRPQAALSFAGAHAEPLGANGLDADRLLLRAAVPVAFEQLGGAEACFRAAINFVSERRTFGRPIGSYQAIKHRLADMYVNIELARSNAYYAAWALSANSDELPVAAATARVSATEAYEFAAAETIQLHGGIGFSWEADCHLHYRRSRVLAQAIGSLAWWQDRLVRALDRLEAA
jgi:alkylation response protein AidB-like acyl-CoA dehydrogenase